MPNLEILLDFWKEASTLLDGGIRTPIKGTFLSLYYTSQSPGK